MLLREFWMLQAYPSYSTMAQIREPAKLLPLQLAQ